MAQPRKKDDSNKVLTGDALSWFAPKGVGDMPAVNDRLFAAIAKQVRYIMIDHQSQTIQQHSTGQMTIVSMQLQCSATCTTLRDSALSNF